MRKAILSVTLAACVAALALAADVQIVPPRDGYLVATGTLTASQVRNLNATPVTVIAAPGSGKAIVVDSLQLTLDFNSNVYDDDGAGEDFYLLYTGGQAVTNACDNATCLNVDQASDAFGYIQSNPVQGYVLASNTSVSITIASGELAAANNDANGDSPIRYRIRYRIVDLAF